MKINSLRLVRIFLAMLVFIPIFLFLCDFVNLLPKQLHGLMHLQVVPAFIADSFFILLFLAILTLLLGRFYCSVLCPMGVFQDIIAWLTQRGKKKNKRKRWYKYAKPMTVLRYAILVFCALFFIFGIVTPLVYLDPYSAFGRIAVNIFRPIFMEVNNLIAWIALKFNNYNFYYITIHTVTWWSLSLSAATLLIVGIMALLRGRLYCNTICPVGTLLGLLSRFSIFRIVLDDSKCNSCGLCEKACKSQCINSKEKTVDHSRCVSCFNCLKRCSSEGVSFSYAYKRKPQQVLSKEKSAPEITCRTNEIGITRRSFLVTSTALAATLPVLPAWANTGKVDETKLTPITPPGSINLKHFKKQCTACHLCITHCPQQILKPAGFKFGFDYAFKPHMVFYEKGFCNYTCTICTQVCPNGAIRRLTVEEKKETQVGIALFDRDICVVITDHTSCGACSEHCPTQAVKMEPYINGLTLPHVYEDLCIGCGGCESICPVRPIKAINILANEFHKKAELPPEGEMLEVDRDNLEFGF